MPQQLKPSKIICIFPDNKVDNNNKKLYSMYMKTTTTQREAIKNVADRIIENGYDADSIGSRLTAIIFAHPILKRTRNADAVAVKILVEVRYLSAPRAAIENEISFADHLLAQL